ncbi:hypothetical protein VFA_001666 [Vibrio furnissii CIP 102972]|nr:hypothetical protein VFA_001666 [Vibrio furnissii CIP 102972]
MPSDIFSVKNMPPPDDLPLNFERLQSVRQLGRRLIDALIDCRNRRRTLRNIIT